MRQPNIIGVITSYNDIAETILAVPALRALSVRYPSAHIVLFTGPKPAEIIQNCPYLRSIRTFAPDHAKPNTADPADVVLSLKAVKPDCAVLLDKSFTTAVSVWSAKVKYRCGISIGIKWFMLNCRAALHLEKTILDEYLDIIATTETPPAGRKLELWLTDEERANALTKLEISPDEPLMAISPGSFDTQAGAWNPSRYAETIARVYNKFGLKPILIGDDTDADVAGTLAQRLPVPYVNAVGKAGLREQIAIIYQSKLYLGGDSFWTLCAVAGETPAVSIYSPVRVKRWVIANPNSKVLYTDTISRHPSIADLKTSIDAISVDKVFETVCELVGNTFTRVET